MKITSLLYVTIVLSPGYVVTKKSKTKRRYDPDEEDAYRTSYILVEECDGRFRVEDLTIPSNRSVRVGMSDVNYHLYTKKNENNADIISGTNFDALSDSHFKASRPNAFIVHGWKCDYTSDININIKPAILENEDANVFVVDWSGPAAKNYIAAKDSVKEVGKVIAKFVEYIVDKHEVPISNFVLIGHSLGAHVVGCAGAALEGKLAVIVGLDPAGPLFSFSNTDNRIDETDAQFVQIIHTNNFLGFYSALGHADYYPNGGKSQAGCGFDIGGSCGHRRAFIYYAESIACGTFTAVLCSNYDDYENGKCDKNPKSKMGEFQIDTKAKGDYYLVTNRDSPFALD